MGIPDHLICLLRNLYSGQKAIFKLDTEQQTGSKSGKEYIKAVYCHPAYLTYIQSTSCEMLGWMKHKLGSRLPGEISITSDMQMTPLLWQKTKKNKRASRWKWKRVKKKNKTNIYFIDYAKAFDCVDHNKLWKILKVIRIPNHFTWHLRNLYASQNSTLRTPYWERSMSSLYIVTLLI